MEVPQLYVKVLEAANLNLPFSQGTIRFILSAPPLELKGISTPLANNPKWKEEEFVFHIQDHEIDFTITLVVEDKNKERIVRLSSAVIPLSTLNDEQSHEAWYELVPNEKNYTMLYRESHIISTSAFIGTETTHTNVHNPHEPQRIHLKLHYTFSQGTDLGATFSLMQKPVSDFSNLLLYDGTWLVNALCEAIDIADSQRVAQALVRVFEYFNNTRTLLRTVIAKEVNTTETTGTLFRSNSMAMKLLSVYAQLTGQQYLRVTLAGPIGDIVADARSVEMDPTKLKPGEDLEENAQHLQSQAQNVLDRILASLDNVPREIRETCLFLKEYVVERFPDHWFIALGGFFFLRYVCPACVAPEGAGVIADVPEPRRRALVLVTKVLQQLANGQEFAGKEAYMKPMNSFIVLNTPRITEFFQRLVQIDLESTDSHLQIRPYAALNDLMDIHAHLKTHLEKIMQILTKNGAPNVAQAQAIIDNFSTGVPNKVEKIHNITSEQLLQLGAIKIPTTSTIDLRTSGGLTSSGGARSKGEEETILNDWPIYTGSQKDANVLAENLLRSILALYTAHTLSCSHSSNKDSKLEDRWKHIEQADQFEVFKTDLTELQKVHLDPLNELQLIAFFVNVFNTMCIHLYVNTYGSLMTKRTGCLLLHKYKIGESDYSMMDILHILRGNPKNHITRHRHIRGGDVRRRYVMAKVDCRIHFALSYLTVTDPYIRIINHYTVEEDLMAAGMEFCQKHISVDSAKKEVTLPEIFHRYASDFGMPKDELVIWLFQYLSKDTRMKLLEFMERKTTIIYTPASTIPQTLPSASSLAPPYSSSILGSSPTSVIATSPVSSSVPLVRNDSAAAIERQSNRVRSSTMGVQKPTTPPILRPMAREEGSPTPLYATVAEAKFATSLPQARVQQNTLASVTSPSFFDEQPSPRAVNSNSLLANARSESAASVLMTPASSTPSIPVLPLLPTSASSPQLSRASNPKTPPGPTRTLSQTSILSSPGIHPSQVSATSLPHLSPAASPTRSPVHPGVRPIERSVSAFTLSSSPPTPPSLWPTSAPGSPDPVVAAQRMAFTASPTPVNTYSTPPTTPNKPTSISVSSPPPMFLGCVDYYGLISPTKSPAGTPTPLSSNITPPPESLASAAPSTTPEPPATSTAPASTFAPVPMSSAPVSPRSAPVTATSAPVPKNPALVPASSPKPKPVFKDAEPELTGLEPSKVKPTKMKSASTMNPSTGKALSKSPSLSASASSSSIMSTKPLSSSPSAPSLATTSTPPRKTSVKAPSPSPPAPVVTPVSPRSTPNQIEPLKQEMVAKLQEIATFLRANMDTASRDVDYVMGLAQLLTYMKKQLESPLHTTTGKLLYRTHSSLSIDATKQETLISSVSKALRLLRDKVNEYKKSIEGENETMAVYMLKNICLCDIKEAMDTFKGKFPTAST